MTKPTETTQRYIVGYMPDDYLESLSKLSPFNLNKIDPPKDWNSREALSAKDTITGIDINNDGYKDIIEGRSYRIGYGTNSNPYQWILFTSIHLGSLKNIYSYDSIPSETPDLIDSSTYQDKQPASYWEESARLMLERKNQKDVLDRAVANNVHSILTFCFNTLGYLDFLEWTQQKELITAARDARIRLKDELPKEFKFAVQSIENAINKTGDVHLSRRLGHILKKIKGENQQLPELKKAYDLWHTEIKPPEDKELEKDILYKFFLRKAKTYYDDYAGEAKFLWKKAKFLEGQMEKGGIFDPTADGFVAKANDYARKMGYANYAELRMKERYNMNVAEFDAMAKKIFKKNKPKFESWFAEMKKMIGRPTWELNIYELAEKKRDAISKKFGLEKPRLTVEDTIKVVKAFYKDLGLDFDNMPNGGRIILVNVASGKDYHFFQNDLKDGKDNIIIFTLDPKKGVTLEYLSTMVHEIAHAIHYHFGSTHSEGSYWGGVGTNSNAIRESIAKAFQGVAYSREFMDRYLVTIKGFENQELRKELAREWNSCNEWFDNILLARGLFETNLYIDTDENGKSISMEERLDYWQNLLHKNIGQDDIGIPSSLTLFYPTGVDYLVYDPFILPAYGVGIEFSQQITNDINRALAAPQKMGKTFQKIVNMFEKADATYFLDDAKRVYK